MTRVLDLRTVELLDCNSEVAGSVPSGAPAVYP
uniref:Uncharacterized protein n=1 Tax=Anguilla anguilla TaxID=7936 RepID=A0A0E9S0X0_ANGAN